MIYGQVIHNDTTQGIKHADQSLTTCCCIKKRFQDLLFNFQKVSAFIGVTFIYVSK